MIIHDHNPQLREATLFVEQLFHQLAAEERVEVHHKLPGEGQPMRRTFYADPKVAAEKAFLLGRAEEVYVGVAPRLGEDGTKEGVARLQVVWADLDAKDGYTRDSRIRQMSDLPLQPAIIVESGGGWHAYFLLKEPAEGPEEMRRAEDVMRRMATKLGGDPVHDRSRILRVPGTYNWKYGEPRPVVMERFDPDLRYELGELEEMVGSLPGHVDGGEVRRAVLSGPLREGERNVALTSVAGSLRNRGLDAETICYVLLEVNRLRCEPSLSEPEVIRISQSISNYPAGSLRYIGSPARRVRHDEGTSR